jgi:hypothetical protein
MELTGFFNTQGQIVFITEEEGAQMGFIKAGIVRSFTAFPEGFNAGDPLTVRRWF